eukprot:1848001-Pyramimonas_sp.AAC.2
MKNNREFGRNPERKRERGACCVVHDLRFSAPLLMVERDAPKEEYHSEKVGWVLSAVYWRRRANVLALDPHPDRAHPDER